MCVGFINTAAPANPSIASQSSSDVARSPGAKRRKLCHMSSTTTITPAQPVDGDGLLNVVHADSGKVSVYGIHRNVVANGEKKCLYFENFFQCIEKFQPNSRSRAIASVHLKDKAAAVFPRFLDYMYDSPDFEFSEETAVALRHLGIFFKSTALEGDAWKFIKKDMKPSNLELYLQDANYFDDKQVATWVAYGCAEHLSSISPKSSVLKLLEPSDFKHTVSLVQLCRMGQSRHLSELVASYCEHHLKTIDERWFREVTNQENLPEISPNAALKLMQIEFQVRPRKINSRGMRLTSLQRRCVHVLHSLDEGDPDESENTSSATLEDSE